MMDIEIIFDTSSAPKIIENVEAVYTKGNLVCIQYFGPYTGTIPKYKGKILRQMLKYPDCKIHHIWHPHGDHGGTNTAPSLKSGE